MNEYQMLADNGGGFYNPIWNGDQVLKDALGVARANSGVDNFANSWFYQLFRPGAQQEKEFGQQIALQMWQNQYNSPAAAMQRMKEAGINPNVAAQGIAGGTPAASQAQVGSSAVGSGEGMADALVGAGTAASNIANSVGEFLKLKSVIGNLDADTAKKFEEAGFTGLQAQGLSISMRYLDDKEKLGVIALAANIDQIKASHDLMLQQIEQSKATIKELESEIELQRTQGALNKALELEAQKRAAEIEQRTIEFQWYNDIRQTYQIDPKLPVVNNMLNWSVMGKDTAPMESVVYNYDKQKYMAEAKYKAASSPWELLGKALSMTNSDLLEPLTKKIEEYLSTSKDKRKGLVSGLLDSFRAVGNAFSNIQAADLDKLLEDVYNP